MYKICFFICNDFFLFLKILSSCSEQRSFKLPFQQSYYVIRYGLKTGNNQNLTSYLKTNIRRAESPKTDLLNCANKN